jgi:malonyl-CoA O-methyltransferase
MQAERSDTRPGPARVDAAAMARAAHRLRAAGAVPWLHQEAARRMAERLPLIKRSPAVVLDDSGPLGASAALLQAAYPKAQVWVQGRDGDTPPAAARRNWWPMGRKAGPTGRWLAFGEPPAVPGELLWSNMALHGEPDPEQAFRRWHRAVAVDGFLMFSTLGPGSLPELRAMYRRQAWGEAMLPFVDMHDLGDMLAQAGFADPVMDQEQVTLTWPDPEACLAELRGLGANVSPHRFAGLRTPRWLQALKTALQQQGPGGRPSLTFELVYGHAFRVATRARVLPETSVSLDDMRSMVRVSKP